MQDFKAKLQMHVEHVKSVGPHCQSEETTKQALVLPLLNLLDFNPFDPLKVKAEHCADLPGIKNNERVDYALYSDGHPVMFIEAKSYTEKLTNHTGQLARYFNATTGVAIAAITNGREWRFFTDLKNPNVMDDTPFLTVNFSDFSESDAEQLARFRYDKFHPDRLRTFAEERVYTDIFRQVIEVCLREPDTEFVKFVATRANLAPKLTTRVIEAITPLVKQSVADAISRMVVSGLSVTRQTPSDELPVVSEVEAITDADTIDPANPRIVTTVAEKRVLSLMQTMLEGQVPPEEIIGKDTESYFAVLYQGKSNRWLARYTGARQKPIVNFIVEMNDDRKSQIARAGLELGPGNSVVLPRPEHLMKLSGIIFDALAYCMDDSNFKIKVKKEEDLPAA